MAFGGYLREILAEMVSLSGRPFHKWPFEKGLGLPWGSNVFDQDVIPPVKFKDTPKTHPLLNLVHSAAEMNSFLKFILKLVFPR